ncbi:tRNA (adenine(58)-N(1))-methyltransferase non-catalytic subunit trm6 [Coelomomyces lativittatus]|nr:tRNA (adenine(58)-N(1))-methyltransferase non-catalytic subunit trm6 [Coelomomyces lativittatus]
MVISLIRLSWLKSPSHFDKSLPISRAFPLDEELEEWENEKNFKEPCMNLTFGELKKKLLEGNFDGILIASGIDAVELVSFLSPLLLPSRPLTIFHTASNYLYPVFQTLRSRHDYLLVNLYTTWFRPYQVLPGRIRPTMTMSGNGGALLVATKVIDGPSVPCTLTPSELKLSNHLKRKRDRVPTT